MNIYNEVISRNINNLYKNAVTMISKNSYSVYTYLEVVSKAGALYRAINCFKLYEGDRVAVVGRNGINWVGAFLAVAHAKLTSVLVDAATPIEEIERQLDSTDVRCVIASTDIAKLLTPNKYQLINLEAPNEENKKYIKYDYPSDGSSRDIATIIFSSGTTGAATGVMHTHNNLIESTQMCTEILRLKNTDSYLSVIPSSHIYGLICLTLAPLLTGASVCYIPEVDGALVKRALEIYKPTIFPSVPRMFDLFKNQIEAMINSDNKTRKMFGLFFPLCKFLRSKCHINLGKILFKSIHRGFGGHIRYMCSAGSSLEKDTAEFYLGVGFDLYITYGATETGIPTIGNRRGDLTADSCGYPYPSAQVKISDNGELLIKNNYQMVGYWGRPDLTENSYVDGWYKTGDLAVLDEKGRYVITGRMKDSIVLDNGKKIDPNDIEKHLAHIENIRELVICGVAEGQGKSDDIYAFVVADDGVDVHIQDRVRAEILRALLPNGAYVKEVVFVRDIPKTALQKPKRYKLRELVSKTEALYTKDDNSTGTVGERLNKLISRVGKLSTNDIKLTDKPFKDYHIDSLGIFELIVLIEEEFKVSIPDNIGMETTVQELLGYANGSKIHIRNNIYPLSRKKLDFFIFKLCRSLLKLMYRTEVVGSENIPDDGGYVLCSNHVSNFDYLWLTINTGKERFMRLFCMAKQELLKSGRLSRLMFRVCGLIPVDRSGIVGETLKKCKTKLREGCGLIIYPEGTRSKDGMLGSLKSGFARIAIESGVPVVPAYIGGAYEVYPKHSRLPKLFDKKFRRFKIRVVYGEPIASVGQTEESLNSLLEVAIKKLMD